jgi:predicted enzyme related to lactoylglutathione lyase
VNCHPLAQEDCQRGIPGTAIIAGTPLAGFGAYVRKDHWRFPYIWRVPEMALFIEAITTDCHDATALAAFWSDALDYRFKTEDADWCLLEDPTGAGPELGFQQVPEGKQVKNRVHLDIATTGATLVDEKQRLVALGATIRHLVNAEGGVTHYTMTDPEGNEFCLLQR